MFHDHLWLMDSALEEARLAYSNKEVPVGAIVVDSRGTIISKAFNQKESQSNPCSHAEILSLQYAGQKLKNWRLTDCTMYVTLEPCPMCMNALVHARIKELVFGAYDPKGGALSLGYNFQRDERLNHHFSIIGGVRHYESSKLLSDFFRKRRSGHIS